MVGLQYGLAFMALQNVNSCSPSRHLQQSVGEIVQLSVPQHDVCQLSIVHVLHLWIARDIQTTNWREYLFTFTFTLRNASCTSK